MPKVKRKKNVSEKNPATLIETDPEVKSFIYQELAELNPYVSPQTVIMVIARDPKEPLEIDDDNYELAQAEKYAHRIAIVLEEDGASIEAESFNNDIFDAIRTAKSILISRLAELQEEAETPNERAELINSYSSNGQLH